MEYAIKNYKDYESIQFSGNVVEVNCKSTVTLYGKVDDDIFAPLTNINKKSSVIKLDFPNSVTFKLTSKHPFSYTIPDMVPRYYDKIKIEDFLYEITYGNIDYDYAYEHFKPIISGGCSTVRNGKLFGRNFDWFYDNHVQFVVHTPSSLDRYGVIGVSGIIPGVVKSNVDNENIIIEGVDMFKLLPFYLLDGINEKGLFCTHNLVPLDDEISPTMEITAKIEERDKVCVPMLVRYVLDKFSTAKQAIDYIQNYVTLYFSDEMIQSGKQSHFMIGDNGTTYIMEFINGEIKVIKGKYITNFNIDGVTFNEDNTIKYPAIENGINKYGSGLERWDIISNNYTISKTLNGMFELMGMLYYSNCYSEPFWYSELVTMEDDSGDTITVDTDKELCTLAKDIAIESYINRDRDNPQTWITCHSSVYDIIGKALYVSNQENDTAYLFKL